MLIDDYDSYLINNLDNRDIFNKFAKILGAIFCILKNQLSKFRCIFLTGITRFKDVTIYSSGNIIADKSLNTEYGAIAGFTTDEIKEHFHDNLIDAIANTYNLIPSDVTDEKIDSLLDELTKWYGGYGFDSSFKTKVFSSNSLIEFLADFDLKTRKICLSNITNLDVVKNSIQSILKNSKESVGEYFVNSNSFENSYALDALDEKVMLYQLGYLPLAREPNF